MDFLYKEKCCCINRPLKFVPYCKDYTQESSIDYRETFSVIVKFTTVRKFPTLATIQNWTNHQIHISNAFLQSQLGTKLYMKLP